MHGNSLHPSASAVPKPLPGARVGAGHAARSWHAPGTLVAGAERFARLHMAPAERERLVGISCELGFPLLELGSGLALPPRNDPKPAASLGTRKGHFAGAQTDPRVRGSQSRSCPCPSAHPIAGASLGAAGAHRVQRDRTRWQPTPPGIGRKCPPRKTIKEIFSSPLAGCARANAPHPRPAASPLVTGRSNQASSAPRQTHARDHGVGPTAPFATQIPETRFQRINSVFKSLTQPVLAGEPQCHSLPVLGCHASAGDSSQPSPAAGNGNPKSPSDVAVWAESPLVTGGLCGFEGQTVSPEGFYSWKRGFRQIPRGSRWGNGQDWALHCPRCTSGGPGRASHQA